jgi:hypothetical protein
MVDDSGDSRSDSAFNWHGFHVSNINGTGNGGTDIDTAADGQGNATCAECHFRVHGTALAVGGQGSAKGLVNFAPNVQDTGGVLQFLPATATQSGSCTLVCHGKEHNTYSYGP